MPSYTVKSGDTLSGIGASQGVDWQSISGYRSGNPNLIYPGEVVSWGAPAPAPAPTAPAAPAPVPVAAKPVAKPVAKPAVGSSSALTNDLTAFDKTAQNPVDIYNNALAKLGITDARTRVTDLRKSLVDNQALLDNLSGNIQGRTANSLVTEAQRQRLQAVESAPIVDMGNKLNQGFGLAQADYNTITGEAKNTTDLTTQGQATKRAALMDRLKLAIDKETNVETKRKWQAEYDRQAKLDAEATAQDARDYNLQVQQDTRDYAYKVSQDAITNAQNQQKINKGDTPKAETKTSILNSLTDDVLANVQDFKTRPEGWTEATLIPSLREKYPDLTYKEITDMVYELRKQYE